MYLMKWERLIELPSRHCKKSDIDWQWSIPQQNIYNWWTTCNTESCDKSYVQLVNRTVFTIQSHGKSCIQFVNNLQYWNIWPTIFSCLGWHFPPKKSLIDEQRTGPQRIKSQDLEESAILNHEAKHFHEVALKQFATWMNCTPHSWINVPLPIHTNTNHFDDTKCTIQKTTFFWQEQPRAKSCSEFCEQFANLARITSSTITSEGTATYKWKVILTSAVDDAVPHPWFVVTCAHLGSQHSVAAWIWNSRSEQASVWDRTRKFQNSVQAIRCG